VFIQILFIIPIGLALLQIILMTCIFKYDTPTILMRRKNHVLLRAFLKKIYNEREVSISKLMNDLKAS